MSSNYVNRKWYTWLDDPITIAPLCPMTMTYFPKGLQNNLAKWLISDATYFIALEVR